MISIDRKVPNIRLSMTATKLFLQTLGISGSTHRAYAIPYVLDVEGPIPVVRIHPNQLDGSSTEVHVDMIDQHGLSLGATCTHKKRNMVLFYKTLETTPLGITLQWVSFH